VFGAQSCRAPSYHSSVVKVPLTQRQSLSQSISSVKCGLYCDQQTLVPPLACQGLLPGGKPGAAASNEARFYHTRETVSNWKLDVAGTKGPADLASRPAGHACSVFSLLAT
jgi:hypothetical protein